MPHGSITKILRTEADTLAFGQILALVLPTGVVCYFRGDLGAGKTSMIRAFLRAHQVTGAIKSPSFALIEPYETNLCAIYHIDLYRLNEASELEAMGLRDYFDSESICLIEWPEKGGVFLPSPDLDFHLEYQDPGRKLTITAKTALGQDLLSSRTWD